jgi:putative transposase
VTWSPRLTKDAQQAGIPLSGDGGLLQQLTKVVLETALQGEMDAHLGYGKHEPAGRTGGNSRNGTRSKTMVTDVGPVEIAVPRDRDASFTPQMVAKRQRRLSGVDDLVISLTARGLTSGEICAHLAEVYGTSVSKEAISVITDPTDRQPVREQPADLDPAGPGQSAHPRGHGRPAGPVSSKPSPQLVRPPRRAPNAFSANC